MSSAFTTPKVICFPLSLCSSGCFLIFLLFFFPLSIWWHVHFSISLPWHHLQTLLFFLSHIQAVHPKHFKILLFLPVPVLKNCHFLSVPEAKKLILTFLSIATCSLLLLKIYSVVKPHKLANKVPVFAFKMITVFTLSCLKITLDTTEVEFLQIHPGTSHSDYPNTVSFYPLFFSTFFSMPDTICL